MSTPAYGGRGPRQQRSGCLTVAYVAVGLLLLSLIAIGIGTWIFVRSETGQRLISTAREGMQMARNAATAPGTDALREAGCSEAMVMAFGRMTELLGDVVNLPPDQGVRGLPEVMVFCEVRSDNVEAPECGALARVYAKAVPKAPARFGMIVQRSNGRRPACEGTYAADGALLGPLSPEGPAREGPVEPGGAF